MKGLRLEAVSYALDHQAILREVNLEIEPGECLGLVGPNGSGKTTLLKLAAGLIAPDSGEILLNGEGLARQKRREIAQQLGYVPQQALLDFQFSVREVVLSGRNPYLSRFQVESEEDRRIAWQALELADLSQFAERLVTTLSGGERQRVVIARSLAQQPNFLLLDEPTSNLDLRHQHEIMGLVARLCQEQGLGVLVALHDLNLAGRYCDRLAVLSKGQLVAIGSPAVVLTSQLMAEVFEVEAEIDHDPAHHNRARVTVLGVVPAKKPEDVR